MSAPIVSVDNLSKRCLVGHNEERGGQYRHTALREALNREIRGFARKAVDVLRGGWALGAQRRQLRGAAA
jgi:hypothetical protein